MPRHGSENASALVQRTPRTGRLASVTNKYRRRASAGVGMPAKLGVHAQAQRAKQRHTAAAAVAAKQKSATPVRVRPTRRPCPAAAEAESHMALPPTTPVCPTPRMVGLPLQLPRPAVAKEVSASAIAAVDPSLVNTPVAYIRDQIVDTGIGRDMYTVCAAIEHTAPHGDAIPDSVDVVLTDFSAEPPTHMLAVWASPTPNAKTAPGPKQRVTLFPVHALVIASHWAHLPPLPAGAPAPEPVKQPDGTYRAQMTLPVVPLCVPDVHAFQLLSAFAYLRDPEMLVRALIPPLPTEAEPTATTTATDPRTRTAALLARAHSSQALLQRALGVSALWRDACALGEWDPRLWAALDAAWSVLAVAMRPSSSAAQHPRRS